MCRHPRPRAADIDLSEWEALVDRVEHLDRPVRIGLIGKYVSLPDAYLSVVEALQPRRLPPRRRASRSSGSRPRTSRGCWPPAGSATSTASSSPAASASGASRARSPPPRYAREQQRPVPRAVPRPADDDHRLRPQRARARAGQLHRDRPADAAPGHRPHGRPARRHRHGRHHAPRRLHRRARPRARRSPRPTARRSCPSATATATSSTPLPPQVRGRRAPVLGHLARRPPGRVHRAARATRSGSAPRPTPSSRAGPTGRRRCSGSSSAPPWPGPRAATPTCSTLDAERRRRVARVVGR